MRNQEVQKVVQQERDSERAPLGENRNGNTYAVFPGGVEGVTAALRSTILAASVGGLIYVGVTKLQAGRKINEIIHGKNRGSILG